MRTKSKVKSEEIANKIREMIIVNKELSPGDRLPDERKMAIDFGVSRTSIREALKILEASGVLEIKKAMGIFVTKNPEISADPLGMSYMEDKKKMMRDWYTVRLVLETELMRMVVENATDEEIAQIIALERAEADSIESGKDDFLELDQRFHTMLAKATHNKVMERLILSLQQSIYYVIAGTQYEDLTRSIQENALVMHREIVRFLELRDVAGAMLAMRFHLLRAIETVEYFT